MTRIRTGDWIREAWSIVQADLGMFIVVMLILCVANSIPYVGTAVLCSVFVMAFKKIQGGGPLNLNGLGRGLQADIGLPAFLACLVQTAIMLPVVGVGVGLMAVSKPLIILVYIPAIVCSMIWMFTMPLIADRKMAFWDAMETSRKTVMADFFGFLGFGIALGLVHLLGAILCGVGVLVTAPVVLVALALAYRDVFGIGGVSATGDIDAWSAGPPPPPVPSPPPPPPPMTPDGVPPEAPYPPPPSQ